MLLLRKAKGTTTKGEKRLVVEEGGISVTLRLKISDPYKKEACQFVDPECWVQGGKYSEMGATYFIKCTTCNEHIDPEIQDKLTVSGGIKAPNYIGMTTSSLQGCIFLI